MIKAVIIDDEENGREIIIQLLQKYDNDIIVVGQADSVKNGFELIKKVQPDLVFLDIRMPDGNGFDLLKKFNSPNFEVIFVTAYDRFAIKAFEFSAAYYLLKPIQKEELLKAIKLVKEKHSYKKSGDRISFLLERIDSFKNAQNKIILPTIHGFDVVNLNDIIRCESEINYTKFHLINNRTILVSKTLKEFETLLSENGFFRVHRSHIINLQHVTRYIKGKGGEVILTDGSSVDVSRERKEEFLKLMGQF